MTLTTTESLVFIPDYRFFSVRDYNMYEQPGAADALTAAYQQIMASNGYESFVVCAQDQVKIRLTVDLHDQPTPPDTVQWDGEPAQFSLPFPSATLHAGDAFGNAITMPLPAEGRYTVIIQHAGRDEATRALAQVWPDAAQLPLDDARDLLDRWAGVERYRVTVFPELVS